MMCRLNRCNLLAVLMGLTVALAACAISETATRKPEETSAADGSPSESGIHATLEGALQEMQRSGDRKVNVFVGEDAAVLQPGDYATILYTARPLGSGSSSSVTADQDASASDLSGTVTVLAGAKQTQFNLGLEMVGMQAGQTKELVLGPDEAFGRRSKQRMAVYPRTKRFPLVVEMEPKQYHQRYRSMPVLSQTVAFNPYVNATVIEITEEKVVVQLLPEHDNIIEEPFGETRIMVNESTAEMVMTLNLEKGAMFLNGRIIEVREDSFVVDHNHPLAGRSIAVEVTLEHFVKPSKFGNTKIEWAEDFGVALSRAQDEQKPVVLLLYADWCKWCKKMLGGTFEDPWVRYFSDRFVWVKVDSDKEHGFMQEFQQKGFPMTVLMGSNGNIFKKLHGYKRAEAMRKELLQLANAEQHG